LTAYNLDFFLEKINLTVLAECPDSTLKPFSLSTQSLSIRVNDVAANIPIQVPQDSSSLVLGD
jgi:hypothetical protein